MLDIGGIGNQKMTYRDHSEIEFLTLNEYTNIAKKILSKFGKGIERSDDVISYVANAIMMGDWRWDSNYKSKDYGRKKDIYSYRNQCGLWAIKTLQTKTKKELSKKYKVYSLDNKISKSEKSYSNFVADETLDPQLILESNESNRENIKFIQDIMSSDILNDKEKDIIQSYYYDGDTLEKIGIRYGLTREAIRQNILKTIKKIKKHAKV